MAKGAEIGFGITEGPQLETNGVLVNDEKSEQPSWMKSEVWRIVSGFMAAVAAVVAMGGMMNKAKADIGEDLSDFSTFLDVPPEMEGPGTTNSCSTYIAPGGAMMMRWRHAYAATDVDINEAEATINTDGTVSIIPSITTVYGDSGIGYGRSFKTQNGNEFLALSGGDLQRNSGLIIDGVGFGLGDPYIDSENIIMAVDMGRTRGITPDSSDTVTMNETYPGPPMPISTIAALRDNVTFISALNPDPSDPNEAYLDSTTVFCDETSPHAYSTKKCTFGMSGDCPSTPEVDTYDIHLMDYDLTMGNWDTDSMVEIASTPTSNEFASCVLSNENAECLFLIQGAGLSAIMKYKCHLRNSDSDGVINFIDNCDFTPNSGQENDIHPGDLEGDACDDPDMDGVFDNVDNCPDIANATQTNVIHSGNGLGDVCDDPDGDGIYDSADSCPDFFDPTDVCLVSPDTGGDGPFDAGTPDILPDMPSPDQMADGPLPDVPIGADAQDGPPPDAEIPDTTPPDVSPDMSPDSGPEPTPDVEVMPEPSVDAGPEPAPDVTHENEDGGSDGMPDAITETEMPVQPNGCSCALAEKPEGSSGNNISLLALGLLALFRRRKSPTE